MVFPSSGVLIQFLVFRRKTSTKLQNPITYMYNIVAAGAVEQDFCVYRPPLDSLWSARACFGDCIALLLSLFWEPLGPLWITLGSLGAHFGTPGDALGRLGDAVGASWGSIGDLVSTGDPFASRRLSSTAPAHKNKPPGTCMAVPPVPLVPVTRRTNYSSGPTFHTRRGSG